MKPLNRSAIRTILFLSLTALISGCTTSVRPQDYAGIPPTHITVNISCNNAAMKFTGTIIADGHPTIYSGTGHGTFQATGHEIICSFKKTGPDGGITLSATSSDKSQGNCSTAVKNGGVRAEFVRTIKDHHDIFTTF